MRRLLARLSITSVLLFAACHVETGSAVERGRAREREWTRKLEALRELNGVLASRRQQWAPVPPAAPAAREAERTQVDGLIAGSRQSLADMQNEIDQATTAIRSVRNQAAAEKTISEEDARITASLRVIEAQIESTEKAMARIEGI